MATLLSDFSQAVADTVEASSSPVVRIEGRDRLPATGVVWSADGVVVTCHHILERDDNIVVGLANGDTLKATLVGRDPGTDLAVLKTDGTNLPVADWESVGDLQVGHLVLALGRPGQSIRATMGIVSVLSQAGSGWRSPPGGMLDRYLQTDLVMYPGFSGGPLVGASGALSGAEHIGPAPQRFGGHTGRNGSGGNRSAIGSWTGAPGSLGRGNSTNPTTRRGLQPAGPRIRSADQLSGTRGCRREWRAVYWRHHRFGGFPSNSAGR